MLVLFPERRCNTIRVQTPEWKPRLVWSCLGLYIVFLTALELKQELWGLVIVAAGFCAAGASCGAQCGLDAAAGVYGDVYRRPFTNPTASFAGVLSNVSHLSEPGLWLTAIGLSQVISNVPSTILLLNYVSPSLLLAWAVNVGALVYYPDRWQI